MVVVIAVLAASLTCQTVEGDADLLTALRTAQQANLDRYPHGELEAVVTSGQTGGYNLYERSEVKTRWKGRSSRSTVAKKSLRGEKAQDPSRLQDQMLVTDHWLVDEKRSIIYSVIARAVLIRPLATYRPPADARCDPRSFWYGGLGGDGIPWLELLDPAKFKGKTPRERISYKARSPSPDRIEVSRLDQVMNAPMTVVCSLEFDGNVVSYEYAMPESRYTTRGSCEWKRDVQGRCYLARLEQRTNHQDGSDETFLIYETTAFLPDVIPRDAEFQLKSLPLTGAVRVEDSVAGRSYRLGDPPIEDVRAGLDGLVEELRAKGFAKEDRR